MPQKNPSHEQSQSEREHSLSFWSKGLGELLAEDENIPMSAAHWDVIFSIRRHYRENGAMRNRKELTERLIQKYASLGGHIYLRILFGDNPVIRASRIAGLPFNAINVA